MENLKVLFPVHIRKKIKNNLWLNDLEEIRIRTGQPIELAYSGKTRYLTDMDGEMCACVRESVQNARACYRITGADIAEMLSYISEYSLYAYQEELRQGYITIEGGHRVGIAGEIAKDREGITGIKYISFMNIRVAHEMIGCADAVFPYIVCNRLLCHTLIVSPPGCGKTTLLRDLIRQISEGNSWLPGLAVGVVDERSEIGGCYMGVAQNHLGIRTDILDGCPKAEGMIMLIRSMGPQVIAVDEIGRPEDVHAIEYAMHCGCKMLATVHAESMEELRKKPLFNRMIGEGRFERYILLGNDAHVGQIEGIFDNRGSLLYKEMMEMAK